MKYLMIATKKADGRYSAFLPDFPGTSVIGDSLEAVAADAQPTVENWMRKKKPDEFPEPGSGDAGEEAARPGSICLLVDIDSSFINNARIRINISIPSYALYMIDSAAKKAGLNRSEYLVKKALA